MEFRPPPVSSTPISGLATWNPLQHLSQTSDKRWAESSRPEFPGYKVPEDDERTKFEAKHDNRKDDPTNRMYTTPVAFSAPSAPFRRTVTFKSSDEIDNELAMLEASKFMSKLPALPKNLTFTCPLEEILGTDGDGYKVGFANATASKIESDALIVHENVCPASEALVSLTTVDIAEAISTIAPIFKEYHQIFVENQCDGNLIALMTETSIGTIAETFSKWGITSSVHCTRIAQVFLEWRTDPPNPATPKKKDKVKNFSGADTYGMTLKKAGALASEISDSSKMTSLKIDEQYSKFKKLHLMPLKSVSGKSTGLPSMGTIEVSLPQVSIPESGALVSVHSKEIERSNDLSVKYPVPRDKLPVKIDVLQERSVSQSEVVANRLTSSQNACDFEKTTATIRHFIDSPMVSGVSEKIQGGDAHFRDSDLKAAALHAPLGSTESHTHSYDASPNVYSRPILPANRYAGTSAQGPISLFPGSFSTNSSGQTEIMCGPISSSAGGNNMNAAAYASLGLVDQANQASQISESLDKSGISAISDLNSKKARKNSPKTGEILSSVLTPKSRTEGRLSLNRPNSATHRVVWVDETEEEGKSGVIAEQNGVADDAKDVDDHRLQDSMNVKTPLTIYLNAADKNFRPTKSKFNAGLQLMPLRQATDNLESKFDSKQRSVGLRFGERTTSASATGVSATGVQFNPVSALFRSKRWKACSNYHLFTSKLQGSKILQRFARCAITPKYKIDFTDEKSMVRCFECSQLFAVYYAVQLKYDDFGDLQPCEEDRETVGFFWTGLAD
jgi:hypothetical protein